METKLVPADNSIATKDPDEIGFLKEAIDEKKDYTSKAISMVADAICSLDSAKKYIDSRGEFQLVADISPEVRKALKEGTKKWDECGDRIFAQLRAADGKLSDKIPLKKIPAEVPIDPMTLALAMQMKAMEKKLDEIVDTLSVIGKNVERVREGQENDRIGLYQSGTNLYREAKMIQDPGLRTLVTANAINSLSTACAQEMQSAISDVKYLVRGGYKDLPKGKIIADINSRIADLNKCLEIIHKSAVVKAGIYYSLGEPDAMLEVFDEYAKFIDNTIIRNKGALAELDSTERRIDSSKWARKKDIIDAVATIRSQIEGTEPLSIPMSMEGVSDYAKER